MKKPKVSVLMSVYNGEIYLQESIESILNQTFKDFEFIIINDGSTDKTYEIFKKYDDSKIVTISNQRNIGLTKSLNKGLAMAQGEYIARMDADDISLSQRLEKQVKFLDDSKNVGLVGSSFFVIDEEANIIQLHKVRTNNMEIKKGLWGNNQFCHGSVMFRKECLEKTGIYREQFKSSQDYDLWLRISDFWDVANIGEPLYNLRANLQSVSVVNKFEQERYALLARISAEERRKTGKDGLQNLKDEEIQNILDRVFPKSRHNERKCLADGYFRWADVFYAAGDYSKATKWLFKSLESRFFYIINWILFLKIVISRISSPKIITLLKFIKNKITCQK